jgi:hypothetical protein
MSGTSLYLFDFDDNIMFLDTPIVLIDTETRQEREVSTRDFARIHQVLGYPGPWQNFSSFPGTFRHFRDQTTDELGDAGEQRFVRDVRDAISADGQAWKGPVWDVFYYACQRQRPISLLTARRHAPETVMAGIDVLVEAGLLPCAPNFLRVLPVSNDKVRRELGDERLDLTVPVLKKRGILAIVDAAEEAYANDSPTRYGMSDDDPANVSLIIQAMSIAKIRYPNARFFVVNTHEGQRVKLEIFPFDMPVVGQPGDMLSA